jgi:hypothetical protein
LTSSFLLYMPVFVALAGGKVALYRPLQAPAGGKVLYHPLVQISVQVSSRKTWENEKNPSKPSKLHIFGLKKSSINSKFYAESVFDVNCYILVSLKVVRPPSP